MPTNKTIRRRAATRKAAGDAVDDDQLFEDLDLDMGGDGAVAPLQRKKGQQGKSQQQQDEEDIVFDRRKKKPVAGGRTLAAADEDDDDNDADDFDNAEDRQVFKNQLLTVHPREGHHNAKEGLRGAFGKQNNKKAALGKHNNNKKHGDLFDDDEDDDDLDEAVIAAQMSRQDRKRLADEDYDLGLPQGLSGNAVPEKEQEQQQPLQKEDTIDMQVNSVAGRFEALSNSERLKMIMEQAPEVAKLMNELEKNLADLKDVFGPLRSALFERKKSLQTAGDSMLLEFLETKVQLMLSYCVHILFYLLLKIEGTKVEGHPVLKRLVELRVYLEKLHPVELRLQHSINRLLSTGTASAAGAAGDAARLNKMRSLNEDEEAAKSGKYVARKSAPVIDDLRQRRRAERLADEMKALEKEEERTMQRKRLTRAEAAKYSGALEQVPIDSQGQEDEDSYLAKASSFLAGGAGVGDDDDEDNNGNGNGMSLIERLRARKRQQKDDEDAAANSLISGKNNKKNQKELKKRLRAEREEEEEGFGGKNNKNKKNSFAEEDDGDFGDEDDFEGDDEDVLDFEELEQEQEQREAQQRADKKHRAENQWQEPESDRREVDESIAKHRGLTKARPKDRKTPRVNAKRKFNIGLRAAKAQNKKVTGGADRESGNAPLKTHVVHSTKL